MSILSRRRKVPTAPAGSGYSLLDAQLTVTGDVDTSGSLRIDGQLDGSVRRADTVVLGVGATMTGDIITQSVLVQEGGVVNGRVLMRPPEPTATDGSPDAPAEKPARSKR